ncbi:MAG: DNA topoisomerase IV subunit A, partial [Desulfobulbaceae bacterium]|nr:DNA topoisomerase IV subunit A [Desulfobulbaceae bacterium]
FFACSEYDRMLLIFSDGMYKVINVIDKLFVGHDLAWVGKVEENIIFNIIYRDGRLNMSYIKRFCSPKFILDKEYRLFTEHKKSQIQLLEIGEGVLARVYFVPSRKAKSNIFDCIFDEFLIKGPGAIGKRISTRRVRRVVTVLGKETVQEKTDLQPLLPGIVGEGE